jgi:hypothetical protein
MVKEEELNDYNLNFLLLMLTTMKIECCNSKRSVYPLVKKYLSSSLKYTLARISSSSQFQRHAVRSAVVLIEHSYEIQSCIVCNVRNQ